MVSHRSASLLWDPAGSLFLLPRRQTITGHGHRRRLLCLREVCLVSIRRFHPKGASIHRHLHLQVRGSRCHRARIISLHLTRWAKGKETTAHGASLEEVDIHQRAVVQDGDSRTCIMYSTIMIPYWINERAFDSVLLFTSLLF